MNARAAGESVASRWIRPSSRHKAGRRSRDDRALKPCHLGHRGGHDRGTRAGEHERDDRLALVGLDGDRGMRAC